MSVYKEPIDWLRATVESILNQTFADFNYIIIVDNPDNIEAINVLNEYASKDSRIQIYVNGKNMGLVKSLNRGLQYCDSEIVARMDADDIAHLDRFEKQLKYMLEMDYDIIGADYNIFHDDVIERTARGPYTDEVCKKILRYESCVAHPLWMVRKEVYDKLQGYREIDSCEDLDFLIRAAIAGYKIGNAPHVLLEYRNNPNSITHEKTAKQQATTVLVTKRMRENKVMTMEEYNEFLKGEKIKKFYRTEERVMKYEELYLNPKSSIIQKYKALCILLTFSRYRYKKYIRFYVRRWKKNEN